MVKKSRIQKNENVEKSVIITFFINIFGLISISLNMMLKNGRCKELILGLIFGIISLFFYISISILLFNDLSFQEKNQNFENYNNKLNLFLLFNGFFILIFIIYYVLKIKSFFKNSPSNR